MRRLMTVRNGLGCVALCAVAGGALVNLLSCGGAPDPFPINGPGQEGNDPPTLTFRAPVTSLTVSQGDRFQIQWEDSDRDDNAQISFILENTATSQQIFLASGIDENDAEGPDSLTVEATLIAVGTYNILGVIQDPVNPAVEVYATLAESGVSQRVVVTIVGPGEGPQTQPPVVAVIEPGFNRSVAQDDIVDIVIQPTVNLPDDDRPYDRDSQVSLFLLLDLDQDPRNDNPGNPDPTRIILLLPVQTIEAGAFDALTFPITIDLALVPPRPNGEPYFIRATISDGTNVAVHSYAPGTLNVVQLAAGELDMFDIGRTKSGAKFQGFNPGANLGSEIAGGTDFDIDGADDFVLVAQFGNPQNVGPVGEAYLVYGQAAPAPQPGQSLRTGTRFGGTIPVNSIADTVSGVIFQAPPVRDFAIPQADARTDGIKAVSFINDISGDGRPELMFGLPHVHGAFDSQDYDTGDQPLGNAESSEGCYPDLLVNNFTDSPDTLVDDTWFFAGGMVVMVNSQNRDNSPAITPAVPRLETTTVSLELAGQRGLVLDAFGVNITGSIFARADNATLDGTALGSDTQEAGRISGARFIAGGFDFIDAFELGQPPREDQWGQSVGFVGDLNSDGLDEVVLSAPRNERYLRDVEEEFGFVGTHFASTVFHGSITVFPGLNYNTEEWRDRTGEEGTATQPIVDQVRFPPGQCSETDPVARSRFIPADTFDVFAEDIDDWLGDGQTAGDINRDGLGDLLCGAPRNNRSTAAPDSGVAYVIYGRTTFGSIFLSAADDPILRPPMLRVRGARIRDQIGWAQSAGLDINGDRIDDVFISSPWTDFGGVTRESCGEDVNGDGVVTGNDFRLATFDSCQESTGDEVFSDDPCKAFDFNNDRTIDFDDRCTFCCLSAECDPDPTCVLGLDPADCCADRVDNGFVGVIFGGIQINGDRDIGQLATSQLPGTVFYGAEAGHLAGYDVGSAGDFNQDGFGDILIAAPGETRLDSAGRERLGIVYLIFGGTHLINTSWRLDSVGTNELPGMIMLSPYVKGSPNEAPALSVGSLGDINDDGFDDIAVGLPDADFIDPSFPQGPEAPGGDASVGRRRDVGDAYVIYGNNFGTNRSVP